MQDLCFIVLTINYGGQKKKKRNNECFRFHELIVFIINNTEIDIWLSPDKTSEVYLTLGFNCVQMRALTAVASAKAGVRVQ